MADNTIINTGTGGDTIRDIDRGGVKTQVTQIDIGGAGAEVLATAGQKAMAASLPVVVASNQTALPTGGDVANGVADTGNPVKVGGKANAVAPAPVVAGNRVDAWNDLYGRRIISDLDPELNLSTGITTYRDRVVAQRYTVLADSIADGLASFWTQTVATSGQIFVTGGEGQIQSNTNATGWAQLISTAPVYLPGQSTWFMSAARFNDGGSVGNTRRIGAFTITGANIPFDGFYFELADTTLNAVVAKNGLYTSTPVGSWSRNGVAPFTVDALYHLFEIRWTANRVDFYIDSVLRHTISGTNSPITVSLNFPMTIQSISTSGTTNRFVGVRNIGIGRFGTTKVSSDGELVAAVSGGGVAVGARGDGFLRTQIDPTTLLFDTFEALDTTNTWTIGGTVVPTGASGVLSVSAGLAASGSSWAVSKPSFIPGSNAFLQVADLITLAAAAETGNKRIFGLGIIAASPTAIIPISNGTVFEVGTDGLLYGAAYSNSIRTQSVALTRPTDGAVHRYSIYYKASRVYFEIDNVQVGSLLFPNPQVAALPLIIGSFNDTTALGTASTLTSTLMGIADTGRNNTQLSDGTYAWRKAQIGKNGGLSVKGTAIPGTSGSIAAAATGTVGPLDVSEAGNVTFIAKPTVAANAVTGNPVIVFEQSDDNITWGPLTVVRADTNLAATTHTLTGGLAANTSLMFDAGMEGVNWVRARVTVAPGTNAMTIAINAGGMAFSPVVTAIAQAAQSTIQTGTITSAAGIAGPFSVLGMTVATMTISGTYAGINAVFEATIDGINWFSLNGLQSYGAAFVSGFFTTANTLYQADFAIAAYTQIRLRATAWTSGTGVVTVSGKGNGAVGLTAATSIGSTQNANPIYTAPVFVGGTDGTLARSLFVKPPSTASIATDQALVVALHPTTPLPAGANTIGAITNPNLDIALSTRLKPADTLAGVTTVGTVTNVTNIVNALPVGANKIGTVDIATAAATAKGTQGANALPTQDLKDSGRVSVSITCYRAAGIITTQALFGANSFARSNDAGTPVNGVQFTVTAGKRFRIQSVQITTYNNAAAAATSKLVLHALAGGGTILISSPPLAIWDIGSNNAVTGNYTNQIVWNVPDGLEILSGYSYGFSNISSAATVLHTITMTGYEY